MPRADRDIVEQRLALLRDAQRLGNVSEACRRHHVSRTQFYEYLRRWQAEGRDGLRDRSRRHRYHPAKASPEAERSILELSHKNPDWGCKRICQHLANTGVRLSSVTIQRILVAYGRGKRSERRAGD